MHANTGRARDLGNFEDGRVDGLAAGSLWKDGIISGADPLHINGSFVYTSKWIHDLEVLSHSPTSSADRY